MKPTPEQRAKVAVKAIEMDLRDRRGLRQEWDAIEDNGIYREIREAWRQPVAKAVRRAEIAVRREAFEEAIAICMKVASLGSWSIDNAEVKSQGDYRHGANEVMHRLKVRMKVKQ